MRLPVLFMSNEQLSQDPQKIPISLIALLIFESNCSKMVMSQSPSIRGRKVHTGKTGGAKRLRPIALYREAKEKARNARSTGLLTAKMVTPDSEIVDPLHNS